VGGGAVIRLAIPGREFQHADIWREEGERAGELRHAAAVAADHKQAGRGRIGLNRDRACEIGEHQPLGAVGNARKRQRPALLQEIGGGMRLGARNAHSIGLRA